MCIAPYQNRSVLFFFLQRSLSKHRHHYYRRLPNKHINVGSRNQRNLQNRILPIGVTDRAKDMSQTIPCSLISSRLDYANSLFVGVSDLEVERLQLIQNSLACVVCSV